MFNALIETIKVLPEDQKPAMFKGDAEVTVDALRNAAAEGIDSNNVIHELQIIDFFKQVQQDLVNDNVPKGVGETLRNEVEALLKDKDLNNLPEAHSYLKH